MSGGASQTIVKKKIFSRDYESDLTMPKKKELSILILSILVLSCLIVFSGDPHSNSKISELSEAVFHVS